MKKEDLRKKRVKKQQKRTKKKQNKTPKPLNYGKFFWKAIYNTFDEKN